MVLMGDETVDLLHQEADRWNEDFNISSENQNDVKESKQNNYLRTVLADHKDIYSPKTRHLNKAKELFTDDMKYTPVGNRSDHSLHNLSYNSLVDDTSNIQPLHTMKKRTYDDLNGGTSRSLDNNGRHLPELSLDSDLDALINEERDNIDHSLNPPTTKGMESSSFMSTSDVNGLNLKVSPIHKQPSKHPTDVVSELTKTLRSRDNEIRTLKSELTRARRQHEVELKRLTEELHLEYSRQASKKLRILYKKAESLAQQKAEQMWSKEIQKLRDAVETERSEKADLVKACDEYLKLNGF